MHCAYPSTRRGTPPGHPVPGGARRGGQRQGWWAHVLGRELRLRPQPPGGGVLTCRRRSAARHMGQRARKGWGGRANGSGPLGPGPTSAAVARGVKPWPSSKDLRPSSCGGGGAGGGGASPGRGWGATLCGIVLRRGREQPRLRGLGFQRKACTIGGRPPSRRPLQVACRLHAPPYPGRTGPNRPAHVLEQRQHARLEAQPDRQVDGGPAAVAQSARQGG
jgi:hypothetical protein